MENKDEAFRYTYNAAQQAEVERIRSKYTVPAEDKLERLRRLDHSVYRKAQTWALVLGVLGTLTFGIGMSLVMTELGAALGQWALPIGILVGLAGMVAVALAYPVYNAIVRRERARIAPEILRLSDELLQ